MLAIVPSATLHGLDGRFIRVEVDVAPGLPGFTIVGLADAALQEARERVRGALRNAGFVHPPRRITVNLAPADLRKAGASLDLAMARRDPARVGAGPGRAGPARADRRAVARRRGPVRAGRPADGRRPRAARAATRRRRDGRGRRGAARRRARGVRRRDARARRSRSSGPAAAPRRAVAAAADRAGRGRDGRPDDGAARRSAAGRIGRRSRTSARSAARLEARRGLEIALAGGHGLLLIGPPGSGKTLLARTIPGLLPPLDDAAALAATVVASAAGEGPIHELRRRPPFRSPHHTVSYAGDGRRRPAPVARRDHAGRPGRPVPRRAARVRPGRPRGAPPADGGGPGRDRAGRPRDDLPGPVPAGRGDEPVPVRVRRHVGPRRAAARRSSRSATSGGSPGRSATGSTCGSRCRASRRSALVGGPDPEGSADVARADRGGPSASRSSRPPGVLNGRLTGRPLRAACRLDRRGRAARRRARRARAGERPRDGAAPPRRPDDRRPGGRRRSCATDHLDEAAWFRPADMRLAAAEAR